MNHPTRRADDHRAALPLRWGERFTLLLTGQNAGVVGAYGATWPGQPAEYERVNVCVEGAQKLDDIEQYRLQMAGISTAALGYWKLGDTIHPDYDTPALRDVAALYAKYDELFKFRESVTSVQASDIPAGMSEVEYWKRYAAGEKACNDQLKRQIAELQKAVPAVVVGARATPMQEGVWHVGYKSGYSDGLQDGKRTAAAVLQLPDDWTAEWDAYSMPGTIRLNSPKWGGCFVSEPKAHDISMSALLHRLLSDILRTRAARAVTAGPDAVDAALTDAIQHGTGAFQVKADGSTEHVDLRQAFDVPPGVRPPGVELTEEQRRYYAELAAFPPKLQRDALYQDYAVPARHASPATCISPGCQAPVTNRMLESCEVHAAEFREWQNNRDKEGDPA